MEQAIELTEVVSERKPFPWRAICLWSVFLAGGWAFPRAIEEARSAYMHREQQFVMSVVERDLKDYPVSVKEVKDKKGKVTYATDADKETLLKTIWALKQEKDSAVEKLNVIRSALEYTEE